MYLTSLGVAGMKILEKKLAYVYASGGGVCAKHGLFRV